MLCGLVQVKLQNKYDFEVSEGELENEAAGGEAEGEEGAAPAPKAKAASAGPKRAPETLYDLVAHAAATRVSAGKYWYDILEEVRQTKEYAHSPLLPSPPLPFCVEGDHTTHDDCR